MDVIASWIWNPLLSFFYLEVGVLFLIFTGFVAWRRSWRGVRRAFSAPKEVSHGRYITPTRAFVTALGASVGIGNLAGVGTAIHLGGPGALFWMWVSALVGMSFRMCSTYFAMRYRPASSDDPTFATPMAYLERFCRGPFAWLPAALAGLIMIKGFLTANLIQSNSVAHALQNDVGFSNLAVAVLMAAAVAVVVLGGVKRIVDFSVQITPWMVLIYVGAGLLILLANPATTWASLQSVFHHAFTPYSVAGGVAGYTVMQGLQYGISRGVFSHGAGIGVEPFLHASNTGNPAQNALIAAFVPVVDTLIVCTITGLVVLSSGYWLEWNGAFLTTQAYQSAYGNTGKLLIVLCLVVFAFTTIINWSYYAERCFQYLGGAKIHIFRWIFIAVTFCGPFLPVKLVWSLGDIMIALVLLLHLLPLTYITLRHLDEMRRDFASVGKADDTADK